MEALEDRTLLSTIMVTGLGDTVADGDGQVTLREAIQAANTNLSVDGSTAGEVDATATDIITFNPTLNGGTIRLGGTALTISSDLSITGPGANLLTLNGDSDNDGTGNSRIFNIDDGVSSQRTVSISGLTLTRGNASGGPASGGAIFNTENLTVIRSTISGNSANNGGGGIGNDGTLTLMQSTVSGNSAINNAGGIGNNFGTLTVIQSTISGNSAGRSVGGINNNGALTVSQSTITGNSAGSSNYLGGGIGTQFGTVTLTNSIVAGNTAGSRASDIESFGAPSVDLAISKNNLIGDAITAGGLNDKSTDPTHGNIVGNNGAGTLDIASVLSPILADNGGPTLTHALVQGSRALNAGDNALIPGAAQVDQRGVGFPRILNSNVDIGAVEVPNAVNDEPIFTLPTTFTVDEDEDTDGDGFSIATLGTGFVTGIQPGPVTDDDEASQTLTFAVTYFSGTVGLFATSPAINASGNVTFTLNANANGSTTFNVVLTDSGSNIAPNDNTSITKQFTINVTAVNDAPVANNDARTTNENTSVTVAAVGVLFNDTDVDVESQTVSKVNGLPTNVGTPITLSSGALLTVSANGSYTYNPNGKFESLDMGETATDSFTYTATDGTVESNTATVTITISGVNDAPITGGAASASGTEDDASISGSVPAATDVDVETVTYVVSGTPPAGVTFNSNGTFSVVPSSADQALDTGESRVFTFQYVANDGSVNSAAATVTVTISGVNDAPVAVNDAGTTNENTSMIVAAAGVLTNDSDVDVELRSVSKVNGSSANVGTQITLTSGALLTVTANGSYTYNPNGRFESLDTGETATDSFTYTATDGTVDSNTATVTITITGVNDAPITGARPARAGRKTTRRSSAVCRRRRTWMSRP